MVISGQGRPRSLRDALLAAALLSLAACRGGSSPPPVAGAIPVSGSERLWWDQEGDVADLRFMAYVDGVPVRLDGASCDATQPGPQGSPCVSPLPPLSDGVHTIELTAVSRSSGLESARSEAVSVQKLPAGATVSGISQRVEEGGLRIRPSGMAHSGDTSPP